MWKKLGIGIAFGIAACSAVASAEEIDVTNLLTESAISAEACAAYLEKCNEIVGEFGECNVVEYLEQHEYEGESTYTSLNAHYLDGLSAVQLLDYDGDGNDDLLVVYREGDLTGDCSYDETTPMPIPQVGNYHLKIWNYTDAGLEELLNYENVGFYNSFFSEFWDSDCCFFSVLRDAEGKTVVQLMFDNEENSVIIDETATENARIAVRILSEGNSDFGGDILHATGGYGYQNVYCENGETMVDTYYFEKGIYTKNGEEIDTEQWEKEVADYSEILYTAILSEDNCPYACTGLGWGYEDEHYGVRLTETLTKSVLDALMAGKPVMCRENSMPEMPEFLKKLAFLNRQNHYPTAEGDLFNNSLTASGDDTYFDVDEDLGDYDDYDVYETVYEPGCFQFEYVLHDMDQDGEPELIIRNCSGEASAVMEVYYYADGVLESAGVMGMSHSSMAVNDDSGNIYVDWTFMGGSSYSELTLQNKKLNETLLDSVNYSGFEDEIYETYKKNRDEKWGKSAHYLRTYPVESPLLLYLYGM